MVGHPRLEFLCKVFLNRANAYTWHLCLVLIIQALVLPQHLHSKDRAFIPMDLPGPSVSRPYPGIPSIRAARNSHRLTTQLVELGPFSSVRPDVTTKMVRMQIQRLHPWSMRQRKMHTCMYTCEGIWMIYPCEFSMFERCLKILTMRIKVLGQGSFIAPLGNWAFPGIPIITLSNQI